MARIETDPNYSSPTFSRATAPTDIFKKEDVQNVAAALSTHDHTSGKGLPLVGASIPNGTITSAMIADGTINALDLAPGVAASNVGTLGGALAGALPNPALATGVAITSPVLSNPILNGTLSGAPSFGAWATWTPACSQGGSSPTVTVNYATYMQIGKTVHISAYLTFTSAGTAGVDIILSSTPGTPRFVGPYMTVGQFTYLRSGTGNYVGSVLATASNLLRFVSSASTGGSLLGTSPSFAVAANDTLSFTLVYEAA